jgi:hypothetical protein
MIIFNNKKDIASYIVTVPAVIECKQAYEGEDLEEFDEIVRELVRLIASGDGSPDFGEDWEQWLAINLEGLLQDAVTIVM